MRIYKPLKYFLLGFLLPHSKSFFYSSKCKKSIILDVGCGNNSVKEIKKFLPNAYYVGVDISDYNLDNFSKKLIDKYILLSKEGFAEGINNIGLSFDIVVSQHNIEHVNDRVSVLLSMVNVIKPGGYLILRFPNSESLEFPSRIGTLNYLDDDTHKLPPPDFEYFKKLLLRNGMNIEYSCKAYKPKFLWLMGLISEPFSKLLKKNLPGTWQYYGFESVIYARKKHK
jgi:SAM-dependent methyltransferase